jgi:acyl-CoA thioesterase I
VGYRVAAALLVVCMMFATSSAQAATARLLMLGDSITAGYGLPAEEALPVRLQAALRAKGVDVEVINAGVSGDTTIGGLERLDWLLADKPTHALVALGGNDALRGLDPAQMRTNLDAIVARLKQAGIPVLLAGMYAPRNLGRAYAESFDAVYRDVAAANKVALYPFLLDGVATDPALNQADGIHPNARGVAVIVEKILPTVTEFLEGAG